LRLITSSNLVGCSTGMSAGLTPRKSLTSFWASSSRKIWTIPGPYATAARVGRERLSYQLRGFFGLAMCGNSD
jgi:hypothetical protein